MRLTSPFLSLVQALGLVSFVSAYPDVLADLRARQGLTGNTAKQYDYIVVGAGQSGLVIAARLSEDSRKSVLVIEHGDFDNDPAQLEPTSAFVYQAKHLYNHTVLPQKGLNNRPSPSWAANVVGGGSTINGMYLDRGSARDYDDWERFGSPGWSFRDVLPFFKKSTTFTPPRADLVKEYNITWDIAAAYGKGPIQTTIADWLWPGIKLQWQIWKEMGLPIQKEGAGGKAFGAFWVPTANNQTYQRSYSVNGYYDPASSRRNLKLIVRHRVHEVVFDRQKRATGVRVQPLDGSPAFVVNAAKEVILTAGWLHTPQILQRSGIGPKALLKEAGIPVLVDLPGVGSNLQDHPAGTAVFQYNNDVVPNQSSLQTNATFIQWADEQWKLRKGPRSVGVGNSMLQVPLPQLTTAWKDIIADLKKQDGKDFLPSTYTPEQIQGWRRQRDLLAASYASLESSVTEIPFSGGATTSLVLQRQASRGTVVLNTTDKYAEPIVDYFTNINPVDRRIGVEMLRFYRKYMAWPSHQVRAPVEIAPGANVTSDEGIADYFANGMISGIGHSCCTAALGPKELGGVLSPELLVHGVTGLSVGDISLIPLIPATHTCATVYAIAEKAADLIKQRA